MISTVRLFLGPGLWFLLLVLTIFTAKSSGDATSPSQEPRVLTLDDSLADVEEIVFAMRISGRDHWYVSFGNYSCTEGEGPKAGFGDYPDGKTPRGYGDGGRLCRLNLRTKELKLLIDDPEGGVRDPQVHYSGEKILFSYRPGGTATYHLYEINIDGSGLRQLTDGPDDDIEPTYLPDGGIVFGSSRCRRFVNCWYSRVATLYRCDGDGQNIRMLSSNNDHDNTPWVLHDGRILYMRWEYVDRSQVHFHHLWTINPDGTGQSVWYGNEHGGVAMLDAKPISGTNKVVASFSPGHGMPEHMGYITVVDPSGGPDLLTTTRRIGKEGELSRDPYPLNEHCFLGANAQGVFAIDGQGNKRMLYELSADDRPMECHEPRPLVAREREVAIADRVDLHETHGELVLADVYEGRNMAGVARGEIKKLLVLEQLPEPVHFSGGMEPLSLGGTFTMSRILGTVPVEPDGSAYMQLPALRSLFFVALDANDMSVKRMQSFVTIQPGERTSCVGCHEQRSQTANLPDTLMALHSPPSEITPLDDVPDVFDFPRDIQPILNAHCVECHNADRREGKVDLSGDHTPRYSMSYVSMFQHELVADGRNQPYANRQPRTIGSSASRLMGYLDGSHHGVKLSPLEHKKVRLWIESSATYPGTYAALGCGMYPVQLSHQSLGGRCASCHDAPPDAPHAAPKFPSFAFESFFNLSQPEKSLVLRAPLAAEAGGLGLCGNAVFVNRDDPDYQRILTAIRESADQLQLRKRFDMPGFQPNEHYVREMQRFQILPADLPNGAPINVYATDQEYWKSFWHAPIEKD
jgi:hypothetical protein